VAQRENALQIPNGALRVRLPDNAVVLTNSAEAQTVPATNSGAGLAGGPGGRRGRGRGERPVFHTVFVLTGDDHDPKLQAVQVKTGISDGISTEVVSGLDEDARVVTGVMATGSIAAAPASPFGGGGFPRR
jgi:hypothetical protein